MTKLQVKHVIANGTIPSAISNTSATSTTGTLYDPFHTTMLPSTKVFLLPTGGTAHATHLSQLLLDVCATTNQVDLVPNLTQTLLSGSKFADAGYTAIYNKDEVISTTPTKSVSTPHSSSRGIDALALDFCRYHYGK